MEKEDLSYKGLFLFSLPSILSSLLEPLSGTVDTALVGQVSTVWLAGLALAVTLISSFTWMFNFLIHASTQSVASRMGSNPEEIPGAIKTSLSVAFAVGIVTTIALWLGKPLLYKLVGVTPEVHQYTDEYFSIRVVGHTFTLLYTTLISLLRGVGKVNQSFYLVGLSTLLNGAFTYLALFVFDLGLTGAAWGTVFSFVLGTGISFFLLVSDEKIRGKFIKSKIYKEDLFRFGKNSLNIFGRSLTLTSCFFISTRLASSMGVIQLGAHQILLQFWLFCSFLLDGLAVTGTVLGAKYYAEKSFEKLRLVFQRILIFSGVVGLIFMVSYLVGGEYVIGLFTSDQKVIALIMSFWWLISLSQFPNSFAFVYDGYIFGLEEFGFLRKHMILGAFLVFLPLVFYAYKIDSLMMIWVGMIALNLYRLVTNSMLIRRVVYA